MKPDSELSSDIQLQSAVLDALRAAAGISTTDIGVAVRDGVVSLTGEVDNLGKRTRAAQAAESVHGVLSVANDIVVRLRQDQRRTDSDIASDAVSALERDTEVPDKTIKARVQDGWIWLVGEADDDHQRRAAERAVQEIAGIKGVSNVVRLKARRA